MERWTAATLAADPRLRRFWQRLRARLEMTGGEISGVMTLRDPTDEERRAVEMLTGTRGRGRDIRIRLDALDQSLRASRLSTGLVAILESDAPLRDRRAESEQLERAVRAAIDPVRTSKLADEPWFTAWLEDVEADGTITRLVKLDAADKLATAVRVLDLLPADGIPLPVLAGQVTNNSKALDRGPLASLVIRALALRDGCDRPARAEARRALWEAFGVVADDLSSQVLVLNLEVHPTNVLGRWLAEARAEGIPFRVTLHQLGTYALDARPAKVFICENPAVLRAAAGRFGSAAAPMLCSEGQPTVAFRRLVRVLVAAGCQFWSHGDFDWPGVRIVGRFLEDVSVHAWRMGAEDYRAALAIADAEDLLPLAGKAAATPWDPTLADAMRTDGRIVYEEMVIESLLSDLGSRR